MSALPFVYAGMGLLQMYQANSQADLTLQRNRTQRRISEMNAKSADLESYDLIRNGYAQSARYQAVIDKTIGSQKVIMAAQNVDVTSGTAKEIQEESKLVGYLNTLDIQNQARGRAKQLQIQAANIRLGGELGSIQAGIDATGQRQAGTLQAIGTGVRAYSSMDSAGWFDQTETDTDIEE